MATKRNTDDDTGLDPIKSGNSDTDDMPDTDDTKSDSTDPSKGDNVHSSIDNNDNEGKTELIESAPLDLSVLETKKKSIFEKADEAKQEKDTKARTAVKNTKKGIKLNFKGVGELVANVLNLVINGFLKLSELTKEEITLLADVTNDLLAVWVSITSQKAITLINFIAVVGAIFIKKLWEFRQMINKAVHDNNEHL